ncbi:ankyrin repeat domain-containing protein [Cupriavidus gilardii]|uniref:ankyrin repeat domain-containing protein n=1 Tax=Cupriavidus gilardii TaxID=82541 RepID=UPI0036F2D254
MGGAIGQAAIASAIRRDRSVQSKPDNLHARNRQGNNALCAAAANGKTDIVRQWVNAGADIDARNEAGRPAARLAARA